MHVTASRLWIALVVAVLATAGCSRDPGKPYPVHGVILFEDGQPAKELAGGSVTFTPTSEGALGSSVGGIGADGTFTLSCKRQADGAVAGKHRVTISAARA